MNEDRLAALLLPLGTGRVPFVENTLFIRARPVPRQWLSGGARSSPPTCLQTFKPDATALEQAGFSVIQELESTARYEQIWLLLPRQRDEARSWLARSVNMLSPGGCLVASAANNEGARSLEADLVRLVGVVNTLVKHKCRTFWTSPELAIDASLLEQWLKLDEPRYIEMGTYVSRPGLFAWDRVDAASKLLAEQLPVTLAGQVADLGGGYGYLSCELLRRCRNVSRLDVYEAEYRAIPLLRANIATLAKPASVECLWHDVCSGLPRQYDAIVTNPPFHGQDRADHPQLGRRFIATAAQALRPGGQLWLVANRHLAYESELASRFSDVRCVAQQNGFKVICARRGAVE